jgi:plasmid maintenance system antidote protein VapI
MTSGPVPSSVRELLDYLIKQNDLKNYTALAVEMGEDRGVISCLVRGKRRLSAKHILFIHEYYGMAVQEIRERSGQYD